MTRPVAEVVEAVNHRRVMDPEARERLNKWAEAQPDWVGYCRKCGKERTGTLADLRKPCGCDD